MMKLGQVLTMKVVDNFVFNPKCLLYPPLPSILPQPWPDPSVCGGHGHGLQCCCCVSFD